MKYDFETIIDRRSRSSAKWEEMDAELGNCSEEIVPFSVADLDFKAAPALKEKLIAYIDEEGTFGYTSANQDFYEAVASWLNRRHDWQIQKEWLVNTSGVMHAVYVAINEFSEEGQGVILFSPVYNPFFDSIRDNRRKLVDCPLLNKDGHYEIDFPTFAKLAKEENNKILLFCSPHNPIGRVWKEDELWKVLAICRENNLLLISDEIHADLVRPGYQHQIIAKLAEGDYQNLIVCTAPSKTFNIAGLQLSNIFIPDTSLRERFVARQRRSGVSSTNSLSYKACEIAYNYCEDWLEELLALVDKNYEILKSFMLQHFPEVVVYPLEGTYLVWMDWNKIKIEDQEIVDFIIKQALVYVTRGIRFSEACFGYLRLSIACPTIVLTQALERIRVAISQQTKS